MNAMTTTTSNLRRVCLAAPLVLLWACTPKPDEAVIAPTPKISENAIVFPSQATPLGLRTAEVTGDAPAPLTVTGRLTWDEDRTTRVYAPVAGRVERLRAQIGQAVQRGQPLADVISADIGQAQAELHKAEADLSLAQAALNRATDLTEAGVMARKDLQQAQADQARATAEAARARTRLAAYGVSSQSVNQSIALVAPLSGVVVERSTNPGAEVRPDVQGAPLFVISDPTHLCALLDVDEASLAAFRVGQTVSLKVAAWPEASFPATVLSLGESVDPATRAVKVRLRVPNPQRQLKAEMFVSASAQLPRSLPTVDADAVFLRGSRTSVFVATGSGRFERRDVTVRSGGPQRWLVLQGLKAGEQVVVGGGLFLNQMLDAPH